MASMTQRVSQALEADLRERLRDELYHALDMHAELSEPEAERAAFAIDIALDAVFSEKPLNSQP